MPVCAFIARMQMAPDSMTTECWREMNKPANDNRPDNQTVSDTISWSQNETFDVHICLDLNAISQFLDLPLSILFMKNDFFLRSIVFSSSFIIFWFALSVKINGLEGFIKYSQCEREQS